VKGESVAGLQDLHQAGVNKAAQKEFSAMEKKHFSRKRMVRICVGK
jgi:hypothetical protein